MPGTNLTRDEAATRASLLDVTSYTVDLDLMSATQPEQGTFGSVTTLEFTCREPGSSTFADLVAPHVREITLNGRTLDPATAYDDNRIALDDLEATNTLVVAADCAYSNTGEGLHRFVDPADDRVYLYSQFEVQRGLPIQLLVKYFTQSGDIWQLNADVRSMVQFRQLNLLQDFSHLGTFDVIFCRNVLIYFTPELQRRALQLFAFSLRAGGRLVLGVADTDQRVDLYALGCVLYEMLVGHTPFGAPAPSVTADNIFFHQRHTAPEPPTRIRTDVPAWLEGTCLKLLAKRPEDRFQTPGDLLAALRAETAGAS